MNNAKVKRLILAIIDMCIILVSGAISALLLEYASPVDISISDFIISSTVFLSFTLVMLKLIGVYDQIVRFSNIRDLLRYFIGICFSSAIYFSIVALVNYTQLFGGGLSEVFALFCCFISCILIIASRVVYMQLYIYIKKFGSKKTAERTLIIGAGMACKELLMEMENSKQYLPVCILDDDKSNLSRSINDVSVIGSTSMLVDACIEHKIETIFFAIPTCSEDAKRRILAQCAITNCKIKQIPALSELVDGKKLLNQSIILNTEDLLGRTAISFDTKDIANFVHDKVCMVTGGGGSIGSELIRQIAKFSPKQIIILDIFENNAYELHQELLMQYGSDLNVVTLIASVRDYGRMNQIFRRYRPQLIFHAAAHKHVPLMEVSPMEAVKNNIIGTLNTATLADYYNAEKFVMISTDKAVNPTNVMGASKRCCEMIMQYMSQEMSNTQFVTTRFGNVLGSNGSVIPLFRKQIESGNPVTVTHPDIIRYFMTIPEAVSLVLQASTMAKSGEIFVLDMGEPIKITTLAENLIRMYGKVPYNEVPIIFSGLRPGEKLFEELLMNEEGLKETANKKLFIGNQINVDSISFMKKLSELKSAAMLNDEDKTIELLLDLVPTFKHSLRS